MMPLCLPQEQEMEKQKLLSEQGRLADRGAAEMVLMYISASKGGSTTVVYWQASDFLDFWDWQTLCPATTSGCISHLLVNVVEICYHMITGTGQNCVQWTLSCGLDWQWDTNPMR